MRIEKVLYKNPNIEMDTKEIDIYNFNLEENYKEMKKHLFCNFPECTAKMSYIPKGKNTAHFKSRQKKDHSMDCQSYFEREAIKDRTSTLLEDYQQLSAKQTRNIFKDAIKRKKETLSQKVLRQKLERERRLLKKQARVNKNSEKINVVSVVKPTTNNDDVEIIKEGKRMKSVRRRFSVLDVLEKDVGNVILLTDNIVSFDLRDKSGTFIINKKNIVANIVLEESFFSGNELLNISSFLNIVDKAVRNEKNISIMCLGTLELVENEFFLSVYSKEEIRINDMEIDTFAIQYNNNH